LRPGFGLAAELPTINRKPRRQPRRRYAANRTPEPPPISSWVLEFDLPSEYVTNGMSTAIDELTKLPLPQRLEIVERLWDSIAADPERLPVTAKQAEELDRRLAAHESNPGEGVAWEEIRERLRKAK